MVAGRRAFLLSMLALAAFAARAQERFITVASTTSTEQSGLFEHLLPVFEQQTGIKVRVVVLGTGQALDVARRGDADVVFVHARAAEEKFLAQGHGLRRYPVMYNDFVLIGPRSDPAGIGNGKDIIAALKKLEAAHAPFVFSKIGSRCLNKPDCSVEVVEATVMNFCCACAVPQATSARRIRNRPKEPPLL